MFVYICIFVCRCFCIYLCVYVNVCLLRASDRSEHTIVLSLTFLYIYMVLPKFSVKYVQSLLRRIMELWKITREGAWDERTLFPIRFGSVTLYPFATC